MRMTTKNRFEKYSNNLENGCIEWTGMLQKNGYGRFRMPDKTVLAHRMAYLLYKGDFNSKFLVCHKCDNRKCVNPDHLFLGTHKDNSLDMHAKNRANNKKTFDDVQIETIKQCFNSGISQSQLSRYFKMSPTHVYNIINNIRRA